LINGSQAWQFSVSGFQQFRVRLTNAITGSGTPTALITHNVSSAPDVSQLTVGSDTNTQWVGPYATSVAVTPTISTSAYTTAYCVGGLLTFANAFRNAVNSGRLQSIFITSKSVQTCTFNIYLLNANPSSSSFTDHATLAGTLNAADVGKVIGVIASGAAASGLGTHTVWNVPAEQMEIVAATSSLYAVVAVVGTPTFASSSDLTFNFTFIQD